jgi:hypothetical protein
MNTSNATKKQTTAKSIKIVKAQPSGTEKSKGPRDCFPLG